MLQRRALHELDARDVLPVPHGLLEEGLVGAAEVSVDLVGDHAEVPDTLLTRGGRSCNAPMRFVPLVSERLVRRNNQFFGLRRLVVKGGLELVDGNFHSINFVFVQELRRNFD